MPVAIGEVVEGRVTGITKFGAFMALPGGESGLVHISEVSTKYVENVEDFLKRNDVVPVKVVSISNEGKIGLSIKQMQLDSNRPPKPVEAPSKPQEPPQAVSFEDKLARFLKDSNEKNDQIRSRDGKTVLYL